MSCDVIESCALLTCAANERLAAIHDRMPVIIAPCDYGLWLDADAAAAALAPLLGSAANADYTLHAVSKRVNSPANDTADCIAPLAPQPRH